MEDKWKRFLEWLTVVIIMFLLCFCVVQHIVVIIIIILYPYSAVILVPYGLWILYDRRAGFRNQKSKLWRNWSAWKYFRDYFPAKLIKTAELPTNKNYLMICHHHAVLPLSVFCNFATEANHVSELFPGIDFRIATLVLLNAPIVRELALFSGFVDLSELTITRLLERNNPTGVVLFPGGISEFGLNKTGSDKFKISASRKGFVRIALKTGASLVPVVVFGDTELIEKKMFCLPNISNWVPNWCSFIRSVAVGALPNGIHLLQILPSKSPLNTIVGAPIEVHKIDNPPSDLIDHYHRKFYEEFKKLFENYKNDYSPVGSSYEFIIA